MSYILDALKRSDQDRKKGDVPNIHSQQDGLVPASRGTHEPSRNYILLWALLPVLAGILIWVLSRSMIGDSSSLPPPAAAPEQSAPVEVSLMDEPPAPQQEDRSTDDAFLDELKDIRLDFPPVNEDEAPESQASMVEEAAAQPPDPLSYSTDERVVEPAPPRESPEPVSAVREPASSTESRVDSDPYEGIPHQRQLPYDLQDALPDMNISVHLYSANPSSRLVRINNAIYHEGDRIDNELRLEQITPDGLIMNFRDERFWRHAR